MGVPQPLSRMYGIGLGRSIPGSLSLGAAHYTLHVAHAVSLAILFHEMQSRGNRDFAQLVKKRINIREIYALAKDRVRLLADEYPSQRL